MCPTFSPEFLFGVSSSSQQIEGATRAQGRGQSIWDGFCRPPGRTAGNATPEVAADHFHRFREDVALMAAAGVQAYRFSLSWPRIFPSPRSRLNESGLDFYRRLLDELEDRGIEPWPCLHHWDLPQWLQHLGGWPHRDTVGRFCDYAEGVAHRLRDRVGRWILLHDPGTVAISGHLTGVHAPGVRDWDACLQAIHHTNLATGLGAQALRAVSSPVEVGTDLLLDWMEPATDSASDHRAAQDLEALFQGAHTDPLLLGHYPSQLEEPLAAVVQEEDLADIHQELDFLGVHHYTRRLVAAAPEAGGGLALDAELVPPPSASPTTAAGWEIYPDGLRLELLRLQERYPLPPLYLTHGIALDDVPGENDRVNDGERIDSLESYLAAALAAMEAGVDLRGYFVRSFLDQFEWHHGYTCRCGLVHVDFRSQARTPKASYAWYQRLVAERRLG